tara:strand:+ start:1030 stop:2457 length:1428 start_codon:yes stop_codon:yes gene_type:complete
MAIGDKIYNLEINDSEFEREGWKNARYKGSKLIGSQINKFNEGDISFANQPVIEQYSKTVYVFNQAKHSFETLNNNFYPPTDEFGQTLEDQIIVGSSQFTIDRAVTFTVDNPSNFSQIDPGINEDESNYIYFDNLIKTDLAIFNSCSVRFFDNTNNGFIKPNYNVEYNKGRFKPAAVYFTSASTNTDIIVDGNDIEVSQSNNGRLYINPNVEEWFTETPFASGSVGSVDNVAIALDHPGDIGKINSVAGYFYNLSKTINKDNSYFISFNRGIEANRIKKDLINKLDVRELAYSGSNIINTTTPTITTRQEGKFNGNSFDSDYNVTDDFVLYKLFPNNNVIHLNFNFNSEAPTGTGNGGVIIPNNLHPKIKESLNIYLSNAGLGAEGGTTSNFNLGGVTAVSNEPSPTPISNNVPNILDIKESNEGFEISPQTLDKSSDVEDILNTEMESFENIPSLPLPNSSGPPLTNSSKADGG